MTVKKPVISNEWNIDLKNWTMRNFQSFNKAVQTADYDEVSRQLSMIVVEWPYPGDPTVADSYMDMVLPEWGKVLRTVGETIRESFAEGN